MVKERKFTNDSKIELKGIVSHIPIFLSFHETSISIWNISCTMTVYHIWMEFNYKIFTPLV